MRRSRILLAVLGVLVPAGIVTTVLLWPKPPPPEAPTTRAAGGSTRESSVAATLPAMEPDTRPAEPAAPVPASRPAEPVIRPVAGPTSGPETVLPRLIVGTSRRPEPAATMPGFVQLVTIDVSPPAPAPAPAAETPTPPPATAPAVVAPASHPAEGPASRPVPARIGPKAPRPTAAIAQQNCVTSQCHVAVKDYKVLHGPVNVNACDACHTLTNANKHTFAMSRDKTATCTFCHKIKIAGEPVVHKPVLTGDCSPCHNPHGGANKKLLRGQTMVELCLKCHKDVAANKKAVHGPVAAGACGSCHLPHTSPLPKLLAAKGRDLCLGCHTEMKKQMASAKFTHKAVQGDCSQCHDPHASDFVMQTRKPPLELCTTACHQKVRAAALEAPQRHSIVTKGQACLNCHTAHGGELANLMKNTPVKACMTCHDKKIELGQGHVVAAVPEVLDPLKIKHGPVRQGNCGGCHAVHGGQYTRLLTAPYPETFYERFRLETYGLCFTCHNKELCLRKESTTVTAFRNGSRNLHYVHVNKGKQGRTCRACHSTHASTNPVHVRESVPYGNWQLPVNYTATATGGRCASGCHRELAYDRNNPVVLNGDVEAADDTSLPGAAATLMTSTRPTRSPGGTAKPPALLKPAPSATAPASSAPAGPTASPAGPAAPIQSGRPMTRPVSLLGGPAALGAAPDGMGKPSVGAVWLRDLIGPTTAPANSKPKEK